METEETMPFPPPLVRRGTPTKGVRAVAARQEFARVPAAPRGAPLSLEQLTEARLAELRGQRLLWETPAPVSAHEETPAQTSRQMVLASASAQSASAQSSALVPHHTPGPLRWRGLPVSPEFQVYALRVARGEDLEPYRGPILADASHALPWALLSEGAEVRSVGKGARRIARSLFVFAALATVAAFVLPSFESLRAQPTAPLASAPSELAAATPTVPGPFVFESAAQPGAAQPAALTPPAPAPSPEAPVLASAPAKAPAKGLRSAQPALPRVAATSGALKRSTPNPSKQATTTAAAAPGEPSGPSPLLVDRPSF